MSYGVVWFKRDLRLHDHAALNQALAGGPILCLYLIEPSLWAQADASAQHYQFIKECLRELAAELKQRDRRSQGELVLQDFLLSRCRGYRGGISSPLSAPTACSRLSAHLAYGTLSLREVVQVTHPHIARLKAQGKGQSTYAAQGLTAFLSRLHWHCHFMQKLESEPELEWRNVHRGYDDLREPDWNPAHFEALKQGRTGWPMVDACVAMLHQTGWLNFLMRAMLVSVAAYPLWLHWREVGLWLTGEFLDHEPGIHWSQLQMQSGTTGINTARVYNPIKQAQDHDPHGAFVRRWLPALRRSDEVRAGKAAIVEKHASRKIPGTRAVGPRRSRQTGHATSAQLSLGFD